MIEQKIEQFWRDATAQDVAGMVKTGKPIPARIRNANNEVWREDLIAGWSLPCFLPVAGWIDEGGVRWRQCQVYEPPQWYLDKPDPGEGYRLLEKFPPEPKLGTDEAWASGSFWQAVQNDNGVQEGTTWYRRRIEPVKQDAGSTCASNIPKGWQYLSLDEPRLASDAFWSIGAKDWVLIGDSRVEYGNREKWPAIRQVETHKTMMLLEGCFYRLPNGQGIKVTKKGFDVF